MFPIAPYRLGLGSTRSVVRNACFLCVGAVTCAIAATVDPPGTASASIDQKRTPYNRGLDQKTIITLSVTFPVAFFVGIFWCWCLSKVCGTGQRPPKARLNHQATLTRVEHVRRTDSFDD